MDPSVIFPVLPVLAAAVGVASGTVTLIIRAVQGYRHVQQRRMRKVIGEAPPQALESHLSLPLLESGLPRGNGQQSPAREPHSNNLPSESTPLIGREREALDIHAQFLQPDVRLLTLVGTGGVGKTRLAVHAGANLLAFFDDGVWFVELAPLTDETRVPHAAATALGLREEPGRTLPDLLADHLKSKRALLILDNCEHVLSASAQLVERLLRSCPHLQVLATSREPLHAPGEITWRVPSLSVPDPGERMTQERLRDYEAPRLFLARASAIRPDQTLTDSHAPAVAEICRRLDGIPLAVELAAARVNVLSVDQIAARLDDRYRLLTGGSRTAPTRQQTLRAALDWSYDLLSEPEQVLFRRLGCFMGGFTLDGAEAVHDADKELELDALDGLGSLLDKSLLKQDTASGQPRFGMLETVRAYALDALDRSGETDLIRQRHASYCLTFAQAALVQLRGPDQMSWLVRLDHEIANLRSTMRWSAQRAKMGDAVAAEQGLQLGGALWWYMHVRGIYGEVRELLLPILGSTVIDRRGNARAKALNTTGVAAWGLGDYVTARAEIEEGLGLLRAQGDRSGACQALLNLGCVAIAQVDGQGAANAFAESLDLARRLGDDWMGAWALTFQGMLAIAQGDLDAARSRFEDCVRLRHRLSDEFGMAWARNGLASVARLRGEPSLARPLYEEALTTFRALGERPTVASILDGLGEVALALGDYAEARVRFGESLALYREMDSLRGMGIALSGFAVLAAAEGSPERAVRLAGAATALHNAGGGAIELIRHRGSDDWLHEARRALGEASAAAAWTEGQTTTPEEAIAEALAADKAHTGALASQFPR